MRDLSSTFSITTPYTTHMCAQEHTHSHTHTHTLHPTLARTCARARARTHTHTHSHYRLKKYDFLHFLIAPECNLDKV